MNVLNDLLNVTFTNIRCGFRIGIFYSTVSSEKIHLIFTIILL